MCRFRLCYSVKVQPFDRLKSEKTEEKLVYANREPDTDFSQW